MATNENSGTVEFKSYAPKNIVFDANATAPSVLLLNDKYDPDWRVTVDGKPAELLRCNFIMRGVYLAPGDHTVEFNFTLPEQTALCHPRGNRHGNSFDRTAGFFTAPQTCGGNLIRAIHKPVG